MDKEELTGLKFNIEKYLSARELVIKMVHEIASKIEIGMNEQDAHNLIDLTFKSYEIKKKWHPNKFRIGINTLKSFKEVSEPAVTIKKEDIFFIDIGPVVEDQEADYGETFTIGNNLEQIKIKEEVKKTFTEVKDYWIDNKCSGMELYEYLNQSVMKKNYQLNFKMAGHRLGDFPHAVYHRDSLKNYDRVPTDNLWVLEVLIKHGSMNFGAFYEDILINNKKTPLKKRGLE